MILLSKCLFCSDGQRNIACVRYCSTLLSHRTSVSISYASIGARTHHTKSSPIFRWCIHAPYALATPFFASLRRLALQRPRFGVNGLGMSRATILESGVVIRFESFELQRFKVDQLKINLSVEFSNAHQTKIHTEMKLLKTYLAAVAIVCEFGLFGC